MAQYFRGEHPQKVDAKARVSIPAAFRTVLSAEDPPNPESNRPRVVMVYGDESRSYAECYTIKGAARIARKVKRLRLGSEEREQANIDLIVRSQTVEVDDDGRVVLPQKVREKIGLGDGGETIFAGLLDTFRIYRRDTYEAAFGKVSAGGGILKGANVLSLIADFDDDDDEED